METPLDEGTKICSNGSGHITKMAATKKTFNILLQNLKADDPGLWYIEFLDLGSNDDHRLTVRNTYKNIENLLTFGLSM